MRRKEQRAAAVLVAMCALATTAWGWWGTVTLEDLNSKLTVDLDSPDGMYTWRIYCTDHLYQQWFWYRIGGSSREKPLDCLDLDHYSLTDEDSDPGKEHLIAVYEDCITPLRVALDFTLVGHAGSTDRSDIQEVITLTNTAATDKEIHFFQYCDLDLAGSVCDYSAKIENGNTAWQWNSSLLTLASEAIVSPDPNHYQVDYYPVILNSLNDSAPTTLQDIAGPIGPGDMTWAFQWDFVIPAGESIVIEKDKRIVPEPAALSALALGGLALIRRGGRPLK
jgi:hypothetical protein